MNVSYKYQVLQYTNEIPKGSKLKISLNEKNEWIELERYNKLRVPTNYGFIHEVRGSDGEFIDCFLVSQSLYPLLTFKVRVLSELLLLDESNNSEIKLIAIPEFSANKYPYINKFKLIWLTFRIMIYLKYCKGLKLSRLRKVSRINN